METILGEQKTISQGCVNCWEDKVLSMTVWITRIYIKARHVWWAPMT